MSKLKKTQLGWFEAVKRYSHWRSVIIIVVVTAVGIAASQALFRDVEQSQRGTFVVGTLDLSVSDDLGGETPQSIQIQKIGKEKQVAGEKTYNLRNVGSLDGELSFKLTNLVNFENGCNEPEALVDTTCDNPGEDQGELGGQIELQVVVGEGQDERVIVTSSLASENLNQFETQWNQANPPIKVKAGKTLPITIKWQSQAGGLGNEVQSDSVKFDIVYELQQIITQ